jgi:hypothetical protein
MFSQLGHISAMMLNANSLAFLQVELESLVQEEAGQALNAHD